MFYVFSEIIGCEIHSSGHSDLKNTLQNLKEEDH